MTARRPETKAQPTPGNAAVTAGHGSRPLVRDQRRDQPTARPCELTRAELEAAAGVRDSAYAEIRELADRAVATGVLSIDGPLEEAEVGQTRPTIRRLT